MNASITDSSDATWKRCAEDRELFEEYVKARCESAYKRGAEAMREAAAKVCDGRADEFRSCTDDRVIRSLQANACSDSAFYVRSLPLPTEGGDRYPCGGTTCEMRGSGVPDGGDCDKCRERGGPPASAAREDGGTERHCETCSSYGDNGERCVSCAALRQPASKREGEG